jgi:hypothetical protein
MNLQTALILIVLSCFGPAVFAQVPPAAKDMQVLKVN